MHQKQHKHLHCLRCVCCTKSLISALSRRCSPIGAVAGLCGTSAERTELSGPMIGTVSPLGSVQKCLGAEVSRHFGTGAKVSQVRTVLGPMCPSAARSTSVLTWHRMVPLHAA